jgi:hypothetical protein
MLRPGIYSFSTVLSWTISARSNQSPAAEIQRLISLMIVRSFTTTRSLLEESRILLTAATRMLFKGVPADSQDCCDDLLHSVSALLGTPRRFSNSVYGNGPIHRLARSSASLVDSELDWHTEDSYCSLPPLFVALLCVRGDPQVVTHLCRLSGPSPDHGAKCLVKPDPYLYGTDDRVIRPIAFEGRKGVGWRFDPALVSSDVQELNRPDDRVIHNPAWTGTLECGDLLIFDNHALAHARDGTSISQHRLVLRMMLG